MCQSLMITMCNYFYQVRPEVSCWGSRRVQIAKSGSESEHYHEAKANYLPHYKLSPENALLKNNNIELFQDSESEVKRGVRQSLPSAETCSN